MLLLDSDGRKEIIPDAGGKTYINADACILEDGTAEIMAHEIGHDFGLGDTYDLQHYYGRENVTGGPNPRRADAVTDGNLVEDGAERLAGLWHVPSYVLASTASVKFQGPTVFVNHQRVSMMGAGNDNWPDLKEWQWLYGKFRTGVLQRPNGFLGVEATHAATANLLTIQGLYDIAGNLTVTEISRGPIYDIRPDPQPGDLFFEQLNVSGAILSSTSFGVDFNQPDSGLATSVHFNLTVPFMTGTTQARIRKGSTVLYSRSISPNAPSIQILTPQGGESLNGPFNITWTATDPDGDPLTYSIFYLRNEINSIPIAIDLTTTSFLWDDPGFNGGGNGRVIILASDGVNETSVESQVFTVPKKTPSVTILSPKDGVSIPPGARIALSGAGYDPEDGDLPSASLSFRSSIDGDLGAGGTIAPTLSQGVHTITLLGVDQDGNAGTASITLTVGATSVPVIDSLSPASGPAGTAVTLSGRNFDPNGSLVRFGGSAATIINASSTQLVVAVPNGLQAGDTEVTVAARGFTSQALTFTVTNGHPLLAALSPNSGASGTPVLISGAEFSPIAAENTVNFSNVQATILAAGVDSILVAVPTGLSLGSVNVNVTTSQGVSNSLPFNVTSGAPKTPVVISSVLPSAAAAGQTVTISGQGFSNVLERNSISIGDVVVAATSVTDSSLQAVIPIELLPGQTNLFVAVNSYPSNPLSFTVTTPAFQFTQSTYSVNENADNAVITVTRSGDASGAATVDYATNDGTAQQRTRYTAASGTLLFAAGENSKTFTVLITNEAYVDGNQTVILTLSHPTGGTTLNAERTATLTIIDDDTSPPTTNPLDDPRFFVHQQYADFLSRLPDQSGWDYWSGQITQCGTDQNCLHNKRIDVSNAFFFEQEYQQTASYVFRLYRAAYGNNQPFPNPDGSNITEAKKLPSYNAFVSDRARVVGGSSLAQSQLALANLMVQRSEFLAKYPETLDGPAFVDALLATINSDSGVDLASQRAALIDLFNSGGRGAVLYRLADDNAQTNPINNRLFIDAEYNRAFVASQYFGYLRRDADIGGFLFWLGQINRAPIRDVPKQHAMVCSFITSAEYQLRLSPVVSRTNGECPQ